MRYTLINFTTNKLKLEQNIYENLQNNCIKVFKEINFNIDMKELLKKIQQKNFLIKNLNL